MRARSLIDIAARGAPPLVGSLPPYTTSFDLTENPISEGGKWVNGEVDGVEWNNVKTNGAGAFATAYPTPGHYDDCIAHLNTSFITFAANQYCEGVVYRAGGYSNGHEIELLLRFQISANNARGYEVYWSTNNGLVIVRWNGALDSFDGLNSTTLVANDGDVLRAEISGSTITVKRNGGTVLTASDSTFASGQPGIGLNSFDPSAVFTSFGWSSWQAGDL